MRSPQIHVRIALAISIVIAADTSEVSAWVADQAVEQQTGKPQVGVCEREGAKIVKQTPARIGGSIRPPKMMHNVSPIYPEVPKGTTASGMWVGETLVDSTGKVSGIWSIREVTFKPAFPAFNAAIVEAIRQWEYEPLIVSGKATPFCMTVSMNIHWR